MAEQGTESAPPPPGAEPVWARIDAALSAGRDAQLCREHVNPAFAKVLRTIGFDRRYRAARGSWLWDDERHAYLDMLGGYAVFNVGRNHPRVKAALAEALERDMAGWVQLETPPLAGLLAQELLRRAPPCLERAFFTNSGTEGIETALKLARAATGRQLAVHTEHGYHGLSTGALSLNGDETFREGFGQLLPSRRVPFDDLEALERALGPGDVAAFVVEPVQGKGVWIPRDGYLRGAQELCRRHGALFVVDEVQTGVGRTGRFLGLDHEEGLAPDVVVLSKALSGGFVPVGVVLATEPVWRATFSSLERSVVHSSTFQMGPLAMVAALTALAVVDDEALLANAERMGERLRLGLEELVPRYEFLHGVRQRGLMVGIQLGPPRSLHLKSAWKAVQLMNENLFPQAVVMPLMQDHRILTQVSGHGQAVIKLTPPLVIGDDEVDHFLRAFEAVMESLHRFPGPLWEVLSKLGKAALPRRQRQSS